MKQYLYSILWAMLVINTTWIIVLICLPLWAVFVVLAVLYGIMIALIIRDVYISSKYDYDD